MKNIILILVISVLAGCASPEYKALKREILTLAPNVKTLKPDSDGWCQIENQCEYLRNLKCGGVTEEECVGHLKIDALKLGGDTIVVHEKKPYIGYRGKILLFAQAYNCTNRFTEFGMRYQLDRPSSLQKVRYLSSAYAKKCDTEKKCKSVSPFECSETNWGPARMCLKTIDKTYTGVGEINTLIFEKETFTELEDNGRYQRGNYLLSGQAYNCKLN